MSGWDQNISEGFQAAHDGIPTTTLNTWPLTPTFPVLIGSCDAFPEETRALQIKEKQEFHERKVQENYDDPNGEKFGPHGTWTNKIDLFSSNAIHGLVGAIPTVAGMIADGVNNLPSLVPGGKDNVFGNEVSFGDQWSNWTANQVDTGLDYFRGEGRRPVEVSKTDEWLASGTEGFYKYVVGIGGLAKGAFNGVKALPYAGNRTAALVTGAAFGGLNGATSFAQAPLETIQSSWEALKNSFEEGKTLAAEVDEEYFSDNDRTTKQPVINTPTSVAPTNF